MSKGIKTITKIKILLEGELTHLPKQEVESMFEDAYGWVNQTERYKLGARLRDAKIRWEKQLEAKNN